MQIQVITVCVGLSKLTSATYPPLFHFFFLSFEQMPPAYLRIRTNRLHLHPLFRKLIEQWTQQFIAGLPASSPTVAIEIEHLLGLRLISFERAHLEDQVQWLFERTQKFGLVGDLARLHLRRLSESWAIDYKPLGHLLPPGRNTQADNTARVIADEDYLKCRIPEAHSRRILPSDENLIVDFPEFPEVHKRWLPLLTKHCLRYVDKQVEHRFITGETWRH
ncbi:hypothetical protein BJ742DRAFT_414000 [Cladochytrium replicatum]|nr:hypothetical protein BJ742DRAFT_414000 [Cladochytrium replicatum]